MFTPLAQEQARGGAYSERVAYWVELQFPNVVRDAVLGLPGARRAVDDLVGVAYDSLVERGVWPDGAPADRPLVSVDRPFASPVVDPSLGYTVYLPSETDPREGDTIAVQREGRGVVSWQVSGISGDAGGKIPLFQTTLLLPELTYIEPSAADSSNALLALWCRTLRGYAHFGVGPRWFVRHEDNENYWDLRELAFDLAVAAGMIERKRAKRGVWVFECVAPKTPRKRARRAR